MFVICRLDCCYVTDATCFLALTFHITKQGHYITITQQFNMTNSPLSPTPWHFITDSAPMTTTSNTIIAIHTLKG